MRSRVGYEVEEKVFLDNVKLDSLCIGRIVLPICDRRRKYTLACYRYLSHRYVSHSVTLVRLLFVHPVGGFQPNPADETADRREGHSRNGRLQECMAHPGGLDDRSGLRTRSDTSGDTATGQFRCYHLLLYIDVFTVWRAGRRRFRSWRRCCFKNIFHPGGSVNDDSPL